VVDWHWRPFRGFVDYCLSFHARSTGWAEVDELT